MLPSSEKRKEPGGPLEKHATLRYLNVVERIG